MSTILFLQNILCIDHLWSVVGSTNIDNHSFGINDEVNREVSGRVEMLGARLHEKSNAGKRRPLIQRKLVWLQERLAGLVSLH